jgi:hypothetical protein
VGGRLGRTVGCSVCDFMCSQLTTASAHLTGIVCLPPVLFPHMLVLGNPGWPASLLTTPILYLGSDRESKS